MLVFTHTTRYNKLIINTLELYITPITLSITLHNNITNNFARTPQEKKILILFIYIFINIYINSILYPVFSIQKYVRKIYCYAVMLCLIVRI